MASANYQRRLRTLTIQGKEIYETKVQQYQQKLLSLKANIECVINSVENTKAFDEITVQTRIAASLEAYECVSSEFVNFLESTRSLESEQERCCHLIIRDTLRDKIHDFLASVKNSVLKSVKLETVSFDGSKSSTKSSLIKKKAELEALKKKAEYAELAKQKAEVEAKMSILLVRQEEQALTQLEEEIQLDDELASIASQRTHEYVNEHFGGDHSHFDNCEQDTPIFQPPPEFQDQDTTLISGSKSFPEILKEHTKEQQPVSTPPYNIRYPYPSVSYIPESEQIDTWPHSKKISSFPYKFNIGKDSDCIPIQNTSYTKPVLDSSAQVNSVSNFGNSSVQFTPNPSAVPFVPRTPGKTCVIDIQENEQNVHPGNVYNPMCYSHAVPGSSVGNNTSSQQLELCKLMTQMMARKDVVLTRLVKFNDSPIQYISWKRTFKEVISEIGVTSAEELDLLIRWLGPESSRQAESIKSACAGDSVHALSKVWDRLDNRFGSPELIEECLKNKIVNFPKLTTSVADSKRLFELYDILCEINCVKNDCRFGRLFAQYDSCLGINQILSHLPVNLQEKWSSQVNRYKKQHDRAYPPFTFFLDFVYEMAKWRTDPSLQYINQPIRSKVPVVSQQPLKIATRKTELVQNQESGSAQVCPIHRTNHNLNECRQFRTKPIAERMEVLKKHKLCFRCCGLKKHTQNKCQAVILCSLCKRSDHPTALHEVKPNNIEFKQKASRFQSPEKYGGEKPGNVSTSCTQICGSTGGASKSCAKILPVYVYPEGKPELSKKVYALIDDQSNRSLATSNLLDNFGEIGEYVNYVLSSCSGKSPKIGRIAKSYTIESLDHSLSIKIPSLVECSDIPNNRQEIPSPDVAKYHLHLNDLATHIPPIDPDIDVEVLIGRDVIQAHYVLDQRIGGNSLPFAQRLPLGWVIIGEICLGKIHCTNSVNVNKTSILTDGRTSCLKPCQNSFSVKTEHIFKKTPLDEIQGPSIEDKLFLELMDANLTMDSDGHWSAPLPFRSSRPVLPNNRELALKRARSLSRSLERDVVKKEHVLGFMQKMIAKGHAEEAAPLTPGTECWYLPFFGIYHPKKPGSIRVVFDSSSKCNGLSLNDVLMKGPDLTNSLLGVLLRFRKEAIAITADVEQMFYNFKVHKFHRNYLRFIWHEENNTSCPLIDYQMTVHVFGNSPSPAIATYALRRSVNKAEKDVQDFVNCNFYVDDGLISCCDEQTAVDLMKRTQKALADGGGLRLHKIVSNSKAVLDSFDADDLSQDLKDLDLGSDEPPIQRSLGLSWNIATDQFVYRISEEKRPFTRRGVLSTINSLFDPLGFAAPVTLCGKLLLREMMSSSGPVLWDEELPDTIKSRWEHWVTSLKFLRNLNIPRRFSDLSFINSSRREVHIFCDASKEAIASVAYLKLIGEDTCSVSFLMAKAKVAPPQGHTIPRLELCAAVLSVELADIIRDQLNLDINTFHFYSDSQVVLGYLSNETRRFYVYVSNRVSRIRASSSPKQWHFVSTDQNPADIASRGIGARELPNTAYLTGPSFLRDSDRTTSEQFSLVEPDMDKEIRPMVQTTKTSLQLTSKWTDKFSRFSRWNGLIKAILALKKIVRKRHGEDPPTRAAAERFVIQVIQHEVFSSDIDALQSEKLLSVHSDLSPLSPFLDQHNILRVGGRLKRAMHLQQYKQPIIIPKKHHVAVLLIRHHHSLTYHQGRHLTEGAVRSAGYWIVGSRRLIVKILRQCVQCKKLRGQFCVQKMADLPEDRLQPGPPFTFVGVDTFGPWPVMFRKTRGGGANHKRWALLFTCLVSRAIHIEVIEELSSASFINAYRRFVAMRGPVQLMRSDNGTNFVGAIQELGIEAEFVENGPIDRKLSTSGTTWKFNPPHASHFGGVWERMIGLSRRILDSMLLQNKLRLTHEVLCTLMAEVCAIVNSRPLTSVSSDPENPIILSPALLLTHKFALDYDFNSLFEIDSKDMLRSQWKEVQGLANEFWTRWSKEYIHTLQSRRKWVSPSRNLKPGDVVLIKEKDSHRMYWPLAIVEQVFPSADQIIRKVQVGVVRDGKRTSYVRPVVELVPLIETV